MLTVNFHTVVHYIAKVEYFNFGGQRENWYFNPQTFRPYFTFLLKTGKMQFAMDHPRNLSTHK